MKGITRVQDLIRQLEGCDMNALVFINVVKYPQEFALRTGVDGEVAWDTSTDVETIPLEVDEEIQVREGMICLTVELTDYSEERREHIKTK